MASRAITTRRVTVSLDDGTWVELKLRGNDRITTLAVVQMLLDTLGTGTGATVAVHK